MEEILPVLKYSTLPGALGGISIFLYSLRKGHYKNNQYSVKFSIELSGSMLLASFIGPLFPETAIVFGSYVTGIFWTGLMQVTRSKVTKTVRALIGEELG